MLQHQQLVGPGSLPGLVAQRGWRYKECRLDRGDPLPAQQVPGQILVVLGGTIGVGVRDHPDHGWMPAELELIQSRLQAGEPVLGDRGWTCWPNWIAGENRSRLAIPC